VLDIKTGNGAFMRERNRARDLASNLIEVATMAGLPCRALITDMNQPLAHSAGNALEMMEAITFLGGGYRHPRLEEVILSLGSELLLLGGLTENRKSARIMLNRVIEMGMAAESFAQMVSLQGGPSDLLEQPSKYLPPAPVVRPLPAQFGGGIEFMDTRAIGLAIITLGGGRKSADDVIDHRVGLSGFCLVGDTVNKGDPLLVIHAADETSWQIAAQTLSEAIVIGRVKDALPAVYEQFP